MASEQDDARHPNTMAELAQAAAFLVGSAREALERGNELRYARRHAQINAVLDDVELLTAEACWNADRPQASLPRLLARVSLPKAV